MTVMRIQDELEPHLSNRGLIRKGKRFLGSAADLDLVVAFNPDARIRQLKTIDVICVFPAGRKLEGDYPEGTFDVFDQSVRGFTGLALRLRGRHAQLA
jgi:hypothetical protein